MCVCVVRVRVGGVMIVKRAAGLLSGLGSWQEEPVIGSIHPSRVEQEAVYKHSLPGMP